MHKSSISRYFIILITSTLLLSCVSSNTNPWQIRQNSPPQVAEQGPSSLSVAAVEQHSLDEPIQQQQPQLQQQVATPPLMANIPTIKVAILLPLSGQHEKLGQAMLQASQMALFDIGSNNFELLPKDTKGTPSGARIAARAALKDGAKLVLGPIFSPSVKSARQVTQSANVNMIAFSTDWTLANSRTFLMGFLPFDQVDRVVNYAARAGYGNIGVLSPNDNYGNAVMSAYNMVSNSIGINTTNITRYSPHSNDLAIKLRNFANYDVRIAAKKNGEEDILPFDAVLMPVGGTTARQIASFLNHYDLPPNKIRRLGTGLLNDASLASDKTLDGSWFAGPSPQSRRKFERTYKKIYGTTPPRISSLSYDATALAAILARAGMQNNNRPAYDHRSITNPNGFAGIDGIFRFHGNGIVERGLAVLEYRNGKIVVIDRAPRTFQSESF